jgi:DNA repair exonuclease SbcCD ATPase subunit
MSEILSTIEKVNNRLVVIEAIQESRNRIINQIDEESSILENIKKEKKLYESSSHAILKFMEACRDKSKSIFEDIGTTALGAVFGEGYQLKINYSESHKSSVADIFISAPTKYDEQIEIELERCGGGLIDLISMVFCISQLELLHPVIEGPILSDEYFKYLSDDLRPQAAEVLRETLNPDNNGAEGIGRQLIMITHAKEFLEYADKVFLVKKISDRTEVEDISSDYICSDKRQKVE